MQLNQLHNFHIFYYEAYFLLWNEEYVVTKLSDKDQYATGARSGLEYQLQAMGLLGRVLQAFSLAERGCCIMDEVDMILHPLHSELNFPLGPKEPLQPSPKMI